MGRDTLIGIADVVLQQLHNASPTALEAGFLVTLPTYLDATDIQRLQLEVNRRAFTYLELTHRPGERRVGVRLQWAKRAQWHR